MQPLPSLEQQIEASRATMHSLLKQRALVEQIASLVRDAVLHGHILFACGNGGSATDAQHLVEELVARYRANRRALPAIALSADSSVLTCIGNDFGFEHVFSRQLEALGRPGDVLVCFSTSGNSPNITAALHMARQRGMATIALLGKDGGAARPLADTALVVEASDTARIQEAHTLLMHYICETVEQAVLNE